MRADREGHDGSQLISRYLVRIARKTLYVRHTFASLSPAEKDTDTRFPEGSKAVVEGAPFRSNAKEFPLGISSHSTDTLLAAHRVVDPADGVFGSPRQTPTRAEDKPGINGAARPGRWSCSNGRAVSYRRTACRARPRVDTNMDFTPAKLGRWARAVRARSPRSIASPASWSRAPAGARSTARSSMTTAGSRPICDGCG